jgi:hypothetical protein
MVRRIFRWLWMFLIVTVSAAQNPNRDLKVGTVQYNQAAWECPGCDLPNTLAARFAWVISGKADLSADRKSLWWANYLDSEGLYVGQFYNYIIDVAEKNHWQHEDMLLHYDVDYSAKSSWTGMDCFDIFEQSGMPFGQLSREGCATAIHGVFLQHKNSYVDVTATIYSGSCGDTCTLKNGTDLLVGYAEPFDRIDFTLAKPRSGGTVSWRYWNGHSWAPITLASDETSGLARSGAVVLTPPSDWQPQSVNGSHNKFWIQLEVNDASEAPRVATVKGDSWMNGPEHMRGWNPRGCQSALITLAYQQTQYCAQPTAGPDAASARWRYQARMNAYANYHNYIFFNPSNQQDDQYSFVGELEARWNAERTHSGLKMNAIFLDNVGGKPTLSSGTFDENRTDLVCSPQCSRGSWATYFLSYATTLRPSFKKAFPELNAVTANVVSLKAYVPVFDGIMQELSASQPYIGDFQNSQFELFDDFLPANNHGGSVGLFSLWDNVHFTMKIGSQGGERGPTYHVVPEGSRLNMVNLATYYIASNVNTALYYNTQGWSYFDTDEFYVFNNTKTAQLSEGLAAGTAAGGSIRLDDATAFTPVGGPLYKKIYLVRIGGKDLAACTRNGNVLTIVPENGTFFASYIVNDYPAGTSVEFAQVEHWSDRHHAIPTASNVWYYSNWWPALWVDIGDPNPNGWKHGERDTSYLTGDVASTYPAGCAPSNKCAPVWRRDFTGYGGTVILDRVFASITAPSELDRPGPPIQLDDPERKLFGPYYILQADGISSGPVNTVSLRADEAVILTKKAVRPANSTRN